MKKIVKHKYKKWEVSIIQFEENTKINYKVTRRLPELTVAETKMFNNKKEALKQFKEWLN